MTTDNLLIILVILVGSDMLISIGNVFQIFLLIKKTIKSMASLLDIENEVSQLPSVVDGVLKVLSTVEQELKDALATNDPALLQQVLDNIVTQKERLAAAVAENTVTTTPVKDETAKVSTVGQQTEQASATEEPAQTNGPGPETTGQSTEGASVAKPVIE